MSKFKISTMFFSKFAIALPLTMLVFSSAAFADGWDKYLLEIAKADAIESKATKASFEKLTNPTITSCNTDGNGTIEIEFPINGTPYRGSLQKENDRLSTATLAKAMTDKEPKPIKYQIQFATDDSNATFEDRLKSTSWFSRDHIRDYWGDVISSSHYRIDFKSKVEKKDVHFYTVSSSFPSDISHGIAKALPKFWDRISASCADGTAMIGPHGAAAATSNASLSTTGAIVKK